MRTRITRSEIATHTGMPDEIAAICQRVLASREEMHQWLASNPELTTAVWLQLWGPKRPESSMARQLVARPLNKEQRSIVIDRENRVGVLADFIDHNRLLPEEQQLLAGKANARAALLEQDWLEADLRKPIALKLGGLPLLREMALGPDGMFTEAELVDLLRAYPAWIGEMSSPQRGASERNRYLRILFGRYPGVVATAVTNPNLTGRCRSEVITSAAGSANLLAEDANRIAMIGEDGLCRITPDQANELHYSLLALLGNPRCPRSVASALSGMGLGGMGLGGDLASSIQRRLGHPEIDGEIADVSDAAAIDWMLRRALPYRGHDSARPGRPVEILALARNPHLDDAQRARLALAISSEVEPELLRGVIDELKARWPDIEFPVTGTSPKRGRSPYRSPQVTEAMEHAAERLGTDPSRWETLIGLLDDYDGTFDELITLAETI